MSNASMHLGQIFLTRRWESTPVRVAWMRKYGTPMSCSRIMAEGASLVCSVDRTRCPVRAAWMAFCAVCRSLSSPTITISGSCRKIFLRMVAKVTSTAG